MGVLKNGGQTNTILVRVYCGNFSELCSYISSCYSLYRVIKSDVLTMLAGWAANLE